MTFSQESRVVDISTVAPVVALKIADRTRALEMLDDSPEGDLPHLRAVLLTDLEWRRRAGLT